MINFESAPAQYRIYGQASNLYKNFLRLQEQALLAQYGKRLRPGYRTAYFEATRRPLDLPGVGSDSATLFSMYSTGVDVSKKDDESGAILVLCLDLYKDGSPFAMEADVSRIDPSFYNIVLGPEMPPSLINDDLFNGGIQSETWHSTPKYLLTDSECGTVLDLLTVQEIGVHVPNFEDHNFINQT